MQTNNVLNRKHPTYNEGMWGVFMFTVLQVHPYQKPPLLKRLFYRCPDPVVTRVPLRGGAFFYKADFFADKHGKTDLSVLPNSVGGCAQRLLWAGAEMQIQPPLQKFAPTLYPEILFLNTALHFLRAQSEPPHTRILGFADSEARLQERIIPFVRLAKTVKIYTAFPNQYDALSKDILAEWGLSVIVSSRKEVLQDCNVVLAPSSETCLGTRGVLCCGREPICYAGEQFSLPQEEEARRPENTDAMLFAAALYELCNVKGLENLRYARLKPIKSETIY